MSAGPRPASTSPGSPAPGSPNQTSDRFRVRFIALDTRASAVHPRIPVRPLVISRHLRYDTPPTHTVTTWDDLACQLTAPPLVCEDKLSVPCYAGVEYPPEAARRLYSLIRWVHLLTYDLDDLPIERALALHQRIVDLGWSCVIHSTHSHRGGMATMRLRIVIPLLRPYAREHHGAYWLAVASMLGILDVADRHARDAGRLAFIPSCPAGALPDAFAVRYGDPHSPWCDPPSLPPVARHLTGEPRDIGRAPLSRERLKRQSKHWAKSITTEGLSEILSLVLDGSPFAPTGARDETAWTLARALAPLYPSPEDHEILLSILAPSLGAMGAPSIDEMRAKLARATREVDKAHEEEEQQRVTRLKAAFAEHDPDRDYGYLDQEIEQWAREQHCTVAELRTRLILHDGSGYRFFVAGKYTDAYPESAAATAALRDLSPAESIGVILRTPDGYPRPLQALMSEYGTAISRTVYDATIQRAYYHPGEREIRLACAPIRPTLTPAFSPTFQRFLDILARDHWLPVMVWLSRIPYTATPLAAMAITGARGTGKSLLAQVLGRVFTTLAIPTLDAALGAWTLPLTRCPLVWADESGIPKDWRGNSKIDEFRRLISDRTRSVSAKFAHDATMIGCIRVVLTANNMSFAELLGGVTKDDIEAIAERIYHWLITDEVAHEARAYLESLPPGDLDAWVLGDVGAAHVLYLRDHVSIPDAWRARRFVLPPSPHLVNAMATKGPLAQDVLRWIHSALQRPQSMRARAILVRPDGVYLFPGDVLDSWMAVLPDVGRPPRLSHLVAALGSFTDARPIRTDRGPRHARYLSVPSLRSWCERSGLAFDDIAPFFAAAQKVPE